MPKIQRRLTDSLLLCWPVVLPVGAVFLVLWWNGSPGFEPLRFTKQAWATASPEVRGQMLGDLLRNEALKEKSIREIHDLLGGPDRRSQHTWTYDVGHRGQNPDGLFSFSYFLHIRFDDGERVASVSVDD